MLVVNLKHNFYIEEWILSISGLCGRFSQFTTAQRVITKIFQTYMKRRDANVLATKGVIGRFSL